jgi:competence ComEA-like helix-hairpin-helix protein
MTPLTTQERKVLIFFCCLFTLGLGLSVFKKSTGCSVCALDLYSHQAGPRALDVNRASREELIALPGIGEKIADAILAYRVRNNGIRDLNELKNIDGIKDAKFDRIKDYLIIKGE